MLHSLQIDWYLYLKQYVREEIWFEHDALHSFIFFFIFILIEVYENRKHYFKNTIFLKKLLEYC